MPLIRCPWNRYWSPLEAPVYVGDDGFIPDPTSKFGKIANRLLLPFSSFRTVPCLVLLGDPGIGKTSAIEGITAESVADGSVRRLDLLRDCGAETLLFRNLFDAPWFKAWEAGENELELFLDSLDECAQQFPIIAPLLHRELAPRPIDRLKLRIVCRTAEWFQTFRGFSEQVQQAWGKGSFAIHELLPLLRDDVGVAARANGIADDAEFLRQVIEREVQGFANRPITLELLINIFKRQGQLPIQLAELYERGLPLLCEDTLRRSEVGLRSRLSGPQQIAVASRIAAAIALGNRLAIRTEPDRGDIEAWELQISELTESSESVNGIEVPVDEAAIRETLASGVFTSPGPERRVFAHQTYLEFLVARYLHRGGFAKEQIYSVITVPDEPELTIAPQFEQITAWLAGMNPDVFSDILAHQPEILVRGDIGAMDAEMRSRLVDALLARIADGAVPDWYLLFPHLKRLDHPRLGHQLKPWIEDSSAQESRDAAIYVAHACSCAELSPDLATLALDSRQPYETRIRAAAAVARIGTADARARLLPLAKGQAGDDPRDELRGYALRALWPDHISAIDLFACLHRAQDDHFLGAYRMFLRHDDFPASLRPQDLVVALQWTVDQQVSQDPTDDLRSCAHKIIVRAWDLCDEDGVRAALAAVFWYQIRRHDHDLGFADRGESAKLLERIQADAGRRRQLIEEMVKTADEKDHVAGLRWTDPPLAQDDDFEWLLERALTAQAPETEKWVALTVAAFRLDMPNHLGAARAALARSTPLRDALWPFLYVQFGSDTARWMKERHEIDESRRKREPAVLNPAPKERVLQALDRCSSPDPTRWYQLVRELTLEPTSTHYSMCMSVRDTPGWKEAAPATRKRIITAASKFVKECTPDESWIATNSVSDKELAAFAAFRLLLEEDGALAELDGSNWRRWAPSLISYPIVDNSDESAEAQRELVALASAHAQDEVLTTVDRLITADNAAHSSIFMLDRLEKAWNDRTASALAQRAARLDLKPKALGDLLDRLLAHGDVRAIAFARSLITVPPPPEGVQREVSLQAAAKLLANDAAAIWDLFWAAADSDSGWAKAVFESLARGFDGRFLRQLTEVQVGRLLDWLLQYYPYASDPNRSGGFMSPDDMVRQWRDGLLYRLRDWGTFAALAKVRRLKSDHPELPWMQRVQVKAERARHGRAWSPVPPRQLIQLAHDRNKRFVAGGQHLLDVLNESLQRLQVKLQGETPRARFLWDTAVHRPKQEEDLSDFIKGHLEDDLVQHGIIAGREVKIRRRNSPDGQPGQLVDIHVDATGADSRSGSPTLIRAIIEVKGSWNAELSTAMETQLLARYLAENQCQHGLYLVGWFLCPYWHDEDSRKAQANRNFASIADARTFLDAQASQLTQLLEPMGGRITAAVVDFTLH